jgi:hypothetical protein
MLQLIVLGFNFLMKAQLLQAKKADLYRLSQVKVQRGYGMLAAPLYFMESIPGLGVQFAGLQMAL